MTWDERPLEENILEKLCGLKYDHSTDIRDRAALEANFREKFQALNRVTLTNAEFASLVDEVVTPEVFAASQRYDVPLLINGMNCRDALPQSRNGRTHA